LRLTFNQDIINYDRMRPTYVKELYNGIIQFSNLCSEKYALEIGIGTGQATPPFLDTGCKLDAVELGKDMAEFVKVKFSKYDKFNIINCDFESAHLDTNCYDLVYSATAFHWIPQEVGYPKVYSLLKSGGALALFWNHAWPVQNELYFAMQEVYAKYRPSNAATIHKLSEENCLKTVDIIKEHGFVDTQYKLYSQTRTFNTDDYISLLNTYSDHRSMRGETRMELEKELCDVIDNYGGKVCIDDNIDLYLARKPC